MFIIVGMVGDSSHVWRADGAHVHIVVALLRHCGVIAYVALSRTFTLHTPQSKLHTIHSPPAGVLPGPRGLLYCRTTLLVLLYLWLNYHFGQHLKHLYKKKLR